MMSDLIDLSAQEHRFIVEASTTHGEWFEFAQHGVALLDNSVVGVLKSRRSSFGRLWSQVTLHLSLALLSTTRRHAIQSSLNLRHVAEYSCLAAYALEHPEVERFVNGSPGQMMIPDGLRKKAYDWVEQAHKPAMDKLGYIRRQLSETHAHANILNSLPTVQKTDNGTRVTYTFFDEVVDDYIKLNLFRVGYLALIVADLVDVLGCKSGRVVLKSDFSAKQSELLTLARHLFSQTRYAVDESFDDMGLDVFN